MSSKELLKEARDLISSISFSNPKVDQSKEMVDKIDKHFKETSDWISAEKEVVEGFAKEYAENECSCYTNDFNGFVNGFEKALLYITGEDEPS